MVSLEHATVVATLDAPHNYKHEKEQMHGSYHSKEWFHHYNRCTRIGNGDKHLSYWTYLCLPVSGSYTRLTTLCCFSHSSFVIGPRILQGWQYAAKESFIPYSMG